MKVAASGVEKEEGEEVLFLRMRRNHVEVRTCAFAKGYCTAMARVLAQVLPSAGVAARRWLLPVLRKEQEKKPSSEV